MSEILTIQEEEELKNILCALMFLNYGVNITNICMEIDFMVGNLKQKIKEMNIPQINDLESLDIILESIAPLYKLYKNGVVNGLIASVDNLESSINE